MIEAQDDKSPGSLEPAWIQINQAWIAYETERALGAIGQNISDYRIGLHT
jgi:hypothetical protein